MYGENTQLAFFFFLAQITLTTRLKQCTPTVNAGREGRAAVRVVAGYRNLSRARKKMETITTCWLGRSGGWFLLLLARAHERKYARYDLLYYIYLKKKKSFAHQISDNVLFVLT